MAHINSSEYSEKNNETISAEAKERINTVAQKAIDILANNPNEQTAIRNLLNEMVSGNLRDPNNIRGIQDGLYEARDERLKTIDPQNRLGALESFSRFMTQFTQNIAHMHRDIQWGNDIDQLTANSSKKIEGVKATYANILKDSHPIQTA